MSSHSAQKYFAPIPTAPKPGAADDNNYEYRRSPTLGPQRTTEAPGYRKSPPPIGEPEREHASGDGYRKSPPQYRRSPPMQRTQVTARNPVTQQVIRVPNSKIVRTIGSESIGPNLVPIFLCSDYMSGACSLGSTCQFLHAHNSTLQSWQPIPLDNKVNLDGTATHEAGWSVQAYDNALTTFLDIPSQFVVQTHGSVNYAMQYNDYGPTGRFRFQICKDYSTGSCENGGKCQYIHANHNLKAMSNSVIHVNYVLDDISSSRYPTLDPGATLRIHDPNIRTQFTDVPSELVLRTAGSEAYMANPNSRMRLQHCAHFYLKKLCNRGPQCNFLHVAHVDPEDTPGLPADMPPLVGDYEGSNGDINSLPTTPRGDPLPAKDDHTAARNSYNTSPTMVREEIVFRNDPYSTDSRVVLRRSPPIVPVGDESAPPKT